MRVDGGCHCGGITYEADIEPDRVALCHCTDCQTLSGSAFVWFVPVARDAFRMLTGEPTIYVKTAESGNRRAQAFCPQCGTRIYASAVVDPPLFNLRVGTLRQRSELPPRKQVWCRSAHEWAMDLRPVEQFAKTP